MAKAIDLGDGYIGKVMPFEPGLDAWSLDTADGKIIHTGYAKDAEQAEAMMRNFLAGGDAVAAAAVPAEAPVASEPEPAGVLIADDKAAEPADDEATDDTSGKKLKGKLPDGFPGKAALDEAGYTTYAKVRKLHDHGKLTEVPGIGEVTAGHIGEALSER